MLKLKNLHAATAEKEILKGINLEIGAGEVHAIMGPNGSGKSTLANTIAGKPGYDITQGELIFQGEDLTPLAPHERALAGIFLAFQYPVELPGVNTAQFLRQSLNAMRTAQGEEELDGAQFLKLAKEKMEIFGMKADFLKRAVNVGFSGGEKKRFDALHMSLLEPQLCLLDETDSGLDIDALKTVAEGVNKLRNGKRSFVVITHYQRLLSYLKPDHVHVLAGGKIVESGGPELAERLEAEGYKEEVA